MIRLLLALFIIISASLAGASYYAYSTYIPQRIEARIIDNFNNFGFEKLAYEKIIHKNGAIIFSNISLDQKQFSTIEKLTIHFSLIDFIFNQNKAQKIVVTNMDLSGEILEGIITFAGWNNKNKIIKSLINMPAKTIIINDSTADILSGEFGGIKIDYNGQIKLSSTNNDIVIKGSALSKQKKLSFQSKINGTISPNGELSITAESDQLSLIQENLSMKRGVATIKFKNTPQSANSFISIEGDFSSVNWNNLPLRDVHTSLKISNNNYIIFAEGKTFGNQNINWNTQINKTSNAVTAETTIIPAKLSDLLSFLEINKRIEKNINFPAFALNLEQPQISINTKIDNDSIINGTFKFTNSNPIFKLDGNFTSNKDSKNIKGNIFTKNTAITAINKNQTPNNSIKFNNTSQGEFIIRNLSDISTFEWFIKTKINKGKIKYNAFTIENVKGDFLYNSTTPKKTKKYLKFKLPLKSYIKQSGIIRLNITDKTKQLFSSIYLKLYGGKIRAKHPLFKDGLLSKNNKLIVSDINLPPLFKDAKFKDVVIFGHLGGVLPLIIKDNKIKISGGLLQSQEKGIVRLPEPLIAGLFPGETRKIQIIRKALKNFRYDFFEIRLDGDLNGRIMITINATGSSPDFNTKDPININLYIETQMSKLFKNLIK